MRRRGACLLAAVAGALTAGCRGRSQEGSVVAVRPAAEQVPSATSLAQRLPAGAHELVFEGRPLFVEVPSGASRAPLVVYLHHLGGDGQDGEAYYGLRASAKERGAVYAVPRSLATEGTPAWNATDGCCERAQATDDVGYLSRALAELLARAPVDPRRVFLVGHSNGGFMAHRMACDRAPLVSGIASLAGATWKDVSLCKPSAPVSVLHVHGTADPTIRYQGGVFRGGHYPPARQAFELWLGLDGCGAATPAPAFTVTSPYGPASVEPRSAQGCRGASAVALWTVAEGDHFPIVGEAGGAAVLDWLFANGRR